MYPKRYEKASAIFELPWDDDSRFSWLWAVVLVSIHTGPPKGGFTSCSVVAAICRPQDLHNDRYSPRCGESARQRDRNRGGIRLLPIIRSLFMCLYTI